MPHQAPTMPLAVLAQPLCRTSSRNITVHPFKPVLRCVAARWMVSCAVRDYQMIAEDQGVKTAKGRDACVASGNHS